MIARYVSEALAKQEAKRNLGPIVESESENGDDNENGNYGGHTNGRGGCRLMEMVMEIMGAKGAVGLARWFEKIESLFHISNCPPKYQVKYASCTLQNSALTWWNA
nr:putative reverse transcriptase domain-containing protein [Tanacetum cinerariifolium]